MADQPGSAAGLARRVHERTGGDLRQVRSALETRGYGAAETQAAVDQLQPRRRAAATSTPGATSTGAPAAQEQGRGAPTKSDPTPGTSRSGKGRGSGRFAGSGRGSGSRSGGWPKGSRPTLRFPSRPTVGGTVGFGAGMLAYVLFLNYLRYGGDGVKGWLGAKFVNKPWTPPAKAASNPGGASAQRKNQLQPGVAYLTSKRRGGRQLQHPATSNPSTTVDQTTRGA